MKARFYWILTLASFFAMLAAGCAVNPNAKLNATITQAHTSSTSLGDDLHTTGNELDAIKTAVPDNATVVAHVGSGKTALSDANKKLVDLNAGLVAGDAAVKEDIADKATIALLHKRWLSPRQLNELHFLEITLAGLAIAWVVFGILAEMGNPIGIAAKFGMGAIETFLTAGLNYIGPLVKKVFGAFNAWIADQFRSLWSKLSSKKAAPAPVVVATVTHTETTVTPVAK